VAATRDSSLRGASRPPGGPIPSHVRRLAHALCWIASEPSVNDASGPSSTATTSLLTATRTLTASLKHGRGSAPAAHAREEVERREITEERELRPPPSVRHLFPDVIAGAAGVCTILLDTPFSASELLSGASGDDLKNLQSIKN
jgi:hypothetical protein